MGQFSAEKPVPPGSTLSGNQHQGVAELCAGVRRGGYSARIVVRRARDKARPHDIGELWPIRLFDLVRGGANIHWKVFARFENNTLLNKKKLRMFQFLWNLSMKRAFCSGDKENFMAEKTLNDLFYDTLKDIYFAERQILKALPKLAKAAKSEELKSAS